MVGVSCRLFAVFINTAFMEDNKEVKNFYYVKGNQNNYTINIGEHSSLKLFGDGKEILDIGKIMDDSEELCHFIHPSVIDDEEKIKIHKEIQNLVHCNNFPNICSYLNSMADEKRILLPIDPNRAFSELHRMGMPGEENEGFSYKNFCKYYRK